VALGISFEFWENLVLRYLKDPNFHDKKIWASIVDGPGGLTLAEFTQREIVYLTLTSILKREEIRFHQASLSSNFGPFAEQNWDIDHPYPFRRFTDPLWILRNEDTVHYIFDVINDKEVYAPVGQSDYIFHEPTLFRHHYEYREPLSLEHCRGISTRHLHYQVEAVFHLQWIAEYADACDKCQEEADQEVRRFARTPEEYRHRPRFHPAYFPYIGRTPSNRNIREVQFYPCYGEPQEVKAPKQLERRPSKSEFFNQIIERHCLEVAVPLFHGLFRSGACPSWEVQVAATSSSSRKRKVPLVTIVPRRSPRLKRLCQLL
jgi:hypothetical protein